MPMELAHLPYKKEIYEDYVGIGGLKQHGKKRWRRHVVDMVEHLITTLKPADLVPHQRQRERIHCGFRLWAHADGGRRPVKKAYPS